jgi:hypothetical protein
MTEADLKRRKATLIGTVAGITFYEDPDYGDDTGLWAVYKSEAQPTDWFHLPEMEEIIDPEDNPDACAEAFMACYR